MRALAITHEPEGHAGQVEARLVERGFTVDTHVVTPDADQANTAQPWPDVADYDLVLAMGSVRSLVNKGEIDTWIHDELDLLRAAHERNQPVLGVCFGGQLMAEALGGSVEKAPVTELGWHEIESSPGSDNPAGPGPWKEWHHDRFHPPEGAEVLAITDHATQLFRLGRTVGTQFHPEVDVAQITAWLRECPPGYLEENGTSADTVLAEMVANEELNIKQCHAFVDWFLDEVAFPDGLPQGSPA